MEWFSLLIPVVVAALLFRTFPLKVVWYELFIPVITTLVVIAITKAVYVRVMTNDTEVYGNYPVRIEYYEDWDEKVSCRHPKYCDRTYTTTENGKTVRKTETYQCGYKHAYDVDYHPPEWKMLDNQSHVRYISEYQYSYILSLFKNETKKDLHRNYHSNDGDMFFSVAPANMIIPFHSEHTYTNKVQLNGDVYKFTVSDKEGKNLGLYEFPQVKDSLNYPALLGINNPALDKQLQEFNAEFGSSRQIRLWFLAFSGKSREIAFKQRDYWKGGNKNEFVVCFDKDNKWIECFCWSPDGYAGNEELKILVRDCGDYTKALDVIRENIRLWKRKPFEEFNYLSVPIGGGGLIIIYICSIISTIGCGCFIINNQWNPYENFRSNNKSYYKNSRSSYFK